VCVCVCACFVFVPMHGYSFELICTKFGLWHPYTLQMVMGGSGLVSAARACGSRSARSDGTPSSTFTEWLKLVYYIRLTVATTRQPEDDRSPHSQVEITVT